MKKISVKMSNKLSGMLNQAVTDMLRVKRMKGYRLNMGTWHAPTGAGGVCEVCMAGSVLASAGVRSDLEIVPFDAGRSTLTGWVERLTPTTARKLRVINYMREGSFGMASNEMRIVLTAAQEKATNKACEVIRGHLDNDTGLAPTRIYRKAAAILEAVGL